MFHIEESGHIDYIYMFMQTPTSVFENVIIFQQFKVFLKLLRIFFYACVTLLCHWTFLKAYIMYINYYMYFANVFSFLTHIIHSLFRSFIFITSNACFVTMLFSLLLWYRTPTRENALWLNTTRSLYTCVAFEFEMWLWFSDDEIESESLLKSIVKNPCSLCDMI